MVAGLAQLALIAGPPHRGTERPLVTHDARINQPSAELGSARPLWNLDELLDVGVPAIEVRHAHPGEHAGERWDPDDEYDEEDEAERDLSYGHEGA